MDTVSIVTATLNRPSLENACASIDLQTYPSWHHYVIGDGVLPTNYVHPQRTTLGFTLSIGASEPTADMKFGTPNPILRWAIEHLSLGTFICFLDDDNAYQPQFLKKMINALQNTQMGIALCILDDLRFKNPTKVTPSLYRIDEDPQPAPLDGYPIMGHCDNSAFLTYSHMAKSVGFPKAAPGEDAIQDFIFIKMLANLYGWVRVPETLVSYGVGPNYPPSSNRCAKK